MTELFSNNHYDRIRFEMQNIFEDGYRDLFVDLTTLIEQGGEDEH